MSTTKRFKVINLKTREEISLSSSSLEEAIQEGLELMEIQIVEVNPKDED